MAGWQSCDTLIKGKAELWALRKLIEKLEREEIGEEDLQEIRQAEIWEIRVLIEKLEEEGAKEDELEELRKELKGLENKERKAVELLSEEDEDILGKDNAEDDTSGEKVASEEEGENTGRRKEASDPNYVIV